MPLHPTKEIGLGARLHLSPQTSQQGSTAGSSIREDGHYYLPPRGVARDVHPPAFRKDRNLAFEGARIPPADLYCEGKAVTATAAPDEWCIDIASPNRLIAPVTE